MSNKKIISVLVKTSIFGLSLLQSAHAALINGGFESPVIGSDVRIITDQSGVPGWRTTASDGAIELWSSGFLGVPAYEGNQFAELSANLVSTLFQDVSGIAAGSDVGFQFAHRGRAGTDTMRFTLTDLGADNAQGGGDDSILFSQQYSDGNQAWGFYTGTGIVTLGNTIRFAYESVSAAGGSPSAGNFLDAADFGVGVGSPVNAVPIPPAILLFFTGLMGLFGFGKRRKQSV